MSEIFFGIDPEKYMIWNGTKYRYPDLNLGMILKAAAKATAQGGIDPDETLVVYNWEQLIPEGEI